MKRTALILPIIVIAIVALMSSLFVVDEREKALVLQFGQIKSIKEDPGLDFKIPLIQDVVRYDDRILSLDTDPIEVTPSDDRRLVVDAFARYRIADVRQFRQAVGVGGLQHRRGPAARYPEPADPRGSGFRRGHLEYDPVVGPGGPDGRESRDPGAPARPAAGARGARRASQADQPAGAEPRRHLCPDAGRARTRGDGRAGAR